MKHMHACTWHTYCTKKEKKKKKDPEKVLSAKVSFMTSFGDRKRMAVMERKGERNSGLCSREIEGMTNMLFFLFFPSSLEVGMWKTVLLKEEHWDNKEIHFGMFSHVLWSWALYLLEWFDGCALYCPAENCTIVIFTGCTLVLGDRTTGGFQETQSELWAAAYYPRTVVQLPVYKGANNVPLLQHHNIDQTENSTANKCAKRLVSNQRHYTTGTANSLRA